MGVALARPAAPAAERFCVAGLALLAVAVLWWRWVGYQGHDDASYAAAALQWANGEAPLGVTHWALRYTLVLPAAALIALFGPSVAALAATDVVAYGLFLAFSYLAARRWFGWPAAMVLLLICTLLPQFPVQATYANPDLLEMAFVMASFWLFLLARERGGPAGLLAGSGVLAGLGFLTRETTLALLLIFGLVWLFRPGFGRLRYGFMALGFLLVIGAQTAYFAVRTGDPLYRTSISASHDKVDRPAKEEAAAAAGHALDSEGVLAGGLVATPLLAVFASQKYGLLFLLAVPAYAALRWERRLRGRHGFVLDCMALGALVSFLFVAVNAEILYVVPRYFMVSAAMAAVPLAVLLGDWLSRPGLRRALAALALLGFSASSVLLLYLENTEPLWAEQRLLDYAALSPAPVHFDPEIWRRARYLALSGDAAYNVSTAPPGPGDLVAKTSDTFDRACMANPGCGVRERLQPFVPGPGWTLAARFEPPWRAITAPLDALGVSGRLPPDIRAKIERPGKSALIYRVPG